MSSEKNPNVAYFCMEYGIDQRFKAYAGGLGILAGDYLKGAHDHQYPIIGIGIRWKQGYTEQKIDASGNASTYNITVARNSHKINGNEGNLIIDTSGAWITLVYTGSTYGWKAA